ERGARLVTVGLPGERGADADQHDNNEASRRASHAPADRRFFSQRSIVLDIWAAVPRAGSRPAQPLIMARVLRRHPDVIERVMPVVWGDGAFIIGLVQRWTFCGLHRRLPQLRSNAVAWIAFRPTSPRLEGHH